MSTRHQNPSQGPRTTHPLCSSLIGAGLALALTATALGQDNAVELRNATGSSGYLRIADDASLEPQTFTLEAWVRPGGAGVGNTLDQGGATVLAKPIEGGAGSFIASYALQWRPNDGRFRGIVSHAFGSSGTTVTGQSVVLAGTPVHVALTFDGSHVRLYVGGALDAVNSANGSGVAYGSNDVLVGAANYCCGFLRRFDGRVDEVRLWDHARDDVSIAAEATCAPAAGTPGLVGRWSFDGGSLADESGHGNDATAVGGGVSTVDPLLTRTASCAPVGTRYCSPGVPNSTGAAGMLSVFGSTAPADDALVLVASSLPSSSFGFFLTSQTQGFVANPAGSQGNLCLGGSIGRYVGNGQIRSTGRGGSFVLRPSLSTTPTPNGLVQVVAGESWSFQAWHRDAVGGQATSNFTDGVRVDYL
ncbi:MAG: LamG domain-containing protein [Planctomycetota bacterium]